MILNALFVCTLLLTMACPLMLAGILGLSLLWVNKPLSAERFTCILVRFSFVVTTLFAIIACVLWMFLGFAKSGFDIARYSFASHFSINVRFYYDGFSLLFLLTSAVVTNLIAFYSQRYMHRDPHYRRFFIIISLFAFGMNLLILAGTMDLIFAGWEIVGLSSFLLISYFFHRPKAVAAAVRAYSIYRFCDLGLLASLLITHFFWHEASLFSDFLNTSSSSIWAHVPNTWRWILSICILLPVLGKSAQVPFCYWLPKAMEGPTQSSAIYYGSLSIHAGVFLLLRTMPIWHGTPGFAYLLGFVGLSTAISATLFAHVQSNIKGQIGYASIAQVGLMLIELSLGLPTLAFIHMIGNALLRCFQLLVSPSILTTHLHMQSSVRSFKKLTTYYVPKMIPSSLHPALYIFALNDGYFEHVINKFVVRPVLHGAYFLNATINEWLIIPSLVSLGISKRNQQTGKGISLFSIGPAGLIMLSFAVVGIVTPALGLVSLCIALMLALCALGERQNPNHALMFAIISYIFAFMGLASGRLESLYAIGLIASSFLALDAMQFMRNRCSFSLTNGYAGLYGQFPLAANLFLIGILGIGSFPVSATFFGEDFLLSAAITSGPHYLIVLHVIFMINGIALIRLYAHTMFGRRDNISTALHLDFTKNQTIARVMLFLLGNIVACIASSAG
jgi:NADH-quinone oxidoreductase subunit L